MPTFYPENLDIEVDEFLDDCNESEIKEVIEWLKESNYIPNSTTELSKGPGSYADIEFDSLIGNLIGNRWKLTTEQENNITDIARKII